MSCLACFLAECREARHGSGCQVPAAAPALTCPRTLSEGAASRSRQIQAHCLLPEATVSLSGRAQQQNTHATARLTPADP